VISATTEIEPEDGRTRLWKITTTPALRSQRTAFVQGLVAAESRGTLRWRSAVVPTGSPLICSASRDPGPR